MNLTKLIELEKVDIPPDARRHDDAALAQLTQDMKSQGQLQEIIVESKEGRFTVIAGVGRTLAAKQLGWSEIRASVRENVTDFDKARITFAENEDREDVDAFYQAKLITKMLKGKNCPQAVLGKELGVSEATVNAYVAVARLPEEVQKLRRLSLGLLTQIVRLNSAEEQIALAKKCVRNEWSVRQAKGWVDKQLGVGDGKGRRRPAADTTPDPLAAEWQKAHEKLMESSSTLWEVEYRMIEMPQTGKKARGWSFAVWPQENLADTMTPKESLARWFAQMAATLGADAGDAQPKTYGEQYLDIMKKQEGMMKKIGRLMKVH